MNRSERLPRKTENFGKVCRISRCILPAGVALLAIAAAPLIVRGDPAARAQLPDGTVVTGAVDGKTPATLAFVAANGGRTIPLAAIHEIHFRPRPRFIQGTTPPRRIMLRGGESLHAEMLSVGESQVSLRAFGGERHSVPRSALSALLQPAGLRLLAYEDFESRPILFEPARLDSTQAHSGRQSLVRRPGEELSTCVLPRPVATGRVDLGFYDTGGVEPGDEWFIEYALGGRADSAALRVIPGWSDPEYRCTVSGERRLALQRLARSAGWHRLTLLLDARQTVILVDGQVLATGPPGAALSAIHSGLVPAAPVDHPPRADKGEPARDRSPAGWIDDVQIFERSDEQPVPINGQKGDLAWLGGGDELFGKAEVIDQRGILLDGRFGRRRLPWSELRGVIFPPERGPVASQVAGLIASIELAPIPGAGSAPNDHIIAALHSWSPRELLAEHPYLGTLRIPVDEINRIVPQFLGSLLPVDPAWHHLGDAIREDFHAQTAEGTRLEWKVRLDAVPKTRGFISLLAADLEPHGARARGGQFQQASDPGDMSTELLVNGRRLADLNRFVSVRSLPGNPQRLRILLPAGLLKAGENVIRIAQRPERDDASEFDDCEISRLALEFEPQPGGDAGP